MCKPRVTLFLLAPALGAIVSQQEDEYYGRASLVEAEDEDEVEDEYYQHSLLEAADEAESVPSAQPLERLGGKGKGKGKLDGVWGEHQWRAGRWAWEKYPWAFSTGTTTPPPVEPPAIIEEPAEPAPVQKGKGKGRGLEPFDCDHKAHNWEAEWSFPKKKWCCMAHSKGCEGSIAQGALSVRPYWANGDMEEARYPGIIGIADKHYDDKRVLAKDPFAPLSYQSR